MVQQAAYLPGRRCAVHHLSYPGGGSADRPCTCGEDHRYPGLQGT